jgi:hypothetical protein
MAKKINRKKTLFMDLNLRKKLVKCYISSIALYGAETWTLREVGAKNLQNFETWCWRRMEKISWTGRAKNQELLHIVTERRNIPHTAKRRKTG